MYRIFKVNVTILQTTVQFFFAPFARRIFVPLLLNLLNFVPPQLFAFIVYTACTKFGQLILRKIITIVAIRLMPYFKAKMHKIRSLLGFRPKPRWGSLQRSPDHPLAGS